MSRNKESKTLRWGYSTGACAAAVAVAAWLRLTRGETPAHVQLRFLDGKDRMLPLTEPGDGCMAAIRKDGGDDPDCTHRSIVYANMRPCGPDDAGPEDYTLAVGGGIVILRGAEGVGLCTRYGLDCEQGRWAINTGPRRMITENLRRVGLNAGCQLLEIGVENGRELAVHTLNPRLGIQDGISILGTTGLVRPYSHDAYIYTVRICVKSHYLSGGSTMVFCTGGRTKAGATACLPQLPESAFTCIGDFIAESLAAACRYGMREIVVACMPGKLCKYAAGFANTHAHKVEQDMDLFRAEVRKTLPDETALHDALERSVSIREALLFIPEAARSDLLHRLARSALEQFARRCTTGTALRLLVFDFDGGFLFEEAREDAADKTFGAGMPPVEADEVETAPILADADAIVGPLYFMRDEPTEAHEENTRSAGGRIDVLSCGIGFARSAEVSALLEGADVVYGSRTLLAACPVVLRESRTIGGNAHADAAEALAQCRAGRRVVALTSGDALYHGFGGTLAGLSWAGDDIVYHPGVTAFQALFHRLGLPWQDARLFSAHSGEHIPTRAIAEAPLSVSYAGKRHPANAIARAVLESQPDAARRAALIAECLGSADERILSGPLDELARVACGPTSILVLFPETWNGQIPHAEAVGKASEGRPAECAPILALGLAEENFERENNLITASDVRAVILSRLQLPAWGTLWDLGAGSGAVGLEAAALRPHLKVHGVERKPERGAFIERNRMHMGVVNYVLHVGDALDVMLDTALDAGNFTLVLPAPDRVFIGGGGEDLPALLAACMDRLRPGGLIVASSVTLESFAALFAWSPELRTGLCRLDVANEQAIAGTRRHLKPQNTIHVFTFRKEANA